ncbi:MAG TPA: ATP-dependent chaperone ClpB [Bryobacteraceae bacterium]|jgi:ATP-dependent Clp protease ATP-binding subunit ClpB|nr:ATP-dependent chaperone ClpB [Bryobacteraceae bacterium]
MFRLDKLTEKAQEALQESQALAEKNQSQVVFPLHLLTTLAEEKEGVVRPVLAKCGVQPDAIVAEAQRMLANLPRTSGMQPGMYISQPLNEVLERAFDEAARFKDEFVSTEHLLLSLAEQPSDPAGQLLNRAGATHDAILKALVSVRGTQRVTDQNPESKYQALERYAHDLTESARQGKLDPVIGREDEIRRVMQVLSRRTKNNPVLIGEPGVGKTAIVEGLAQRIVRGDVPDQLKGKRLVGIDLGSMIAGTKFRGEFEDRLKAVVREIIDSNGEIICFIDELHTLVGAGSAEGAIDAANLLKPALARGELRCIGATTLSEYKKHVEKDAALARRFQTVMVGEPSVDDTIAILRGLKEKFEIHHGVRIKDSAIIAAAVLSHRYIADRFLPDKAIDLIDEAGSALRLQIGSMPIEIDQLDRRMAHLEVERQALSKEKDHSSMERLRHVESELEAIHGEAAVLKERWNREKGAINRVKELKAEQENLRKDEEKARAAGDWEKAAQITYGRMAQIEKDIQAAEQALESVKETALLKEEIDEDDIARIVAKWTGIPVTRMLEGEIQKLVHMPERLKDRVVGQDEAVRLVSNAILRNRAGLSDPNRPIGSFIFLGPTGVGKTELVRALAQYLFDDDKAMIRIDMSEYMEKHAVARMVGAPPGYVGYEEGGQLSEQVRRRPYSVVLFDEIEKAHPDVFNMLLQILDDGRLTDGQGRTVSFKNTVIVMTSNVGTGMVEKNTIGFSVHGKDKGTDDTRKRLLDKLREHFRPEFLNRVDDIIVFNSLSREHLGLIVDIQLQNVRKMLKDRRIDLEVTPAAKERLIAEGYDPQYGARPMKRAIQRLIQDPLALKLINGEFLEGDTVVVDAGTTEGELTFTKLVPVAV